MRLGVRASLITKIGDDSNGESLLNFCKKNNLKKDLILIKPGLTSAFTYILVDSQTNTRTCIHTPSEEEVLEEEIREELLDGIDFLYLDTRHILAALKLAKLASKRNIPILVDCEKIRISYKLYSELLSYASYLVTNAHFPSLYSLAKDNDSSLFLLDYMQKVNSNWNLFYFSNLFFFYKIQKLLFSNPKTSFLITTLGENGSVLIQRTFATDSIPESSQIVTLNHFEEFETKLLVSKCFKAFSFENKTCKFVGFYCPAYQVSHVKDTIGCGDYFIGSAIVSILTRKSLPQLLSISSYVAAKKCEGIQVCLQDIPKDLFAN